jgi:radical SAM protein with 4Fe4S-binding SPASM domain
VKYFLSNIQKAAAAIIHGRVTIEADGIPYEFENLSRKKILNACLTEVSTYFKPGKPWGFPTNVMIEPSTHCNLRCALCPVTKGLERRTGNMSLELYKKVVREIGDYLFTILLWDWGEPFINPKIYPMISFAKKYDTKVISSTNGHLFENVGNADRLINSGIDTIIFAIDGISDTTYEVYRQGGSLKSALKGMETVARQKAALKFTSPLIVFRFIVMEHNEHEIPELKRLAEATGADALVLKTLNAASQDPYFESGSSSREDFTQFMPKNIKYRRFKFDQGGLKKLRLKKNPCRNLWTCPTIHWSGTVCPCTYDPKDKYVLGDLRENTFREVWTGSGYETMRRRFRRNWEQIGLCTECSYAYKGGDCSRETISEVIFFDGR